MYATDAYDRFRAPQRRRPRVLVVDDDPEIVALLAPPAQAVVGDVRLDWVASLCAASAELERARYDLVLTDWHLANGESGLDLASLVTSLQPAATFAVMTGSSVSEFLLAVGQPPGAFLSKPFSQAACRGFFASVLP